MNRINISLKKWVIFTVVLAFAACTQYKNLDKVPATDVKSVVREEYTDASDTTSIASIPWKTYFPDENLQTLISDGLKNNYSMQTALKQIEIAQATLNMSRASYLPTVNAAAQITHTRTSDGSNGVDVFGYYSNVNSLGVSLSWEADLWGKLSNQNKSKYALYLNTVENRKLIQTTLISNIATYYYTLESLDEQLRITEETINILKESAKTMMALKEAGQTTQAAVEQSNALVYSTQISVYSLKSEIQKAENALCVLTGQKPGSITRTSLAQQTVPATMNGNIAVGQLANRPDVKQAELSLQSTYALTKAAKAALYPSLSISSLSVGFSAGSFADFFSPAHLAAQLIGGLTQPIWANGQLKANLKIAQAQQDEALLAFSNTMLTAGQEVSDILYTYHSSVDKNAWREKQINALTKAVDYTQELLKAGNATYTEVLTAQQSLLSAKLSKVSDKLEQLTQSVNLYRALGGGVN